MTPFLLFPLSTSSTARMVLASPRPISVVVFGVSDDILMCPLHKRSRSIYPLSRLQGDKHRYFCTVIVISILSHPCKTLLRQLQHPVIRSVHYLFLLYFPFCSHQSIYASE